MGSATQILKRRGGVVDPDDQVRLIQRKPAPDRNRQKLQRRAVLQIWKAAQPCGIHRSHQQELGHLFVGPPLLKLDCHAE